MRSLRGRGETYEAFITRVSRNPLARRVKLADLDDNMDARRLGRRLTDADVARVGKYERAAQALIDA
jgi:hypothetical protein